MAEPFKNMFREETVSQIAVALAAVGPLNVEMFIKDALDGLDALELKDRVRHLSAVMRKHLDDDYGAAVAQILRALPEPLSRARTVTSGFVIWPSCQFVEDHGVDDPDTSLPALYELTRRFSAEFAIRPFLMRYPKRTFALLAEWATDEDQHVRRLVSEGSRPRLPWGQRLNFFVEDPTPLLPLLEKLRDDPEEYVRRSVANNLNDIAKDHPGVVVDLCRRWLKGASKERHRLIRHALRSLIKQGHQGALELLGFGPPEVEVVSFTCPEKASVGDKVQLELILRSESTHQQNLVIDYALHFPGAGGRVNRKIFKWRTTVVAGNGDLSVRHSHSFRQVSTRATRAGSYRFELMINGKSFGEVELDLAE